MAFNLRRAIVRNGVLSGGVCLLAGIGYTVYSGDGNFNPVSLLWPCVPALGGVVLHPGKSPPRS